MSLDRSLGVGVGLFMTVMLAAFSAAQAGFGFLWSGGHRRQLPPHRDPRTIHKYTNAGLDGLRKFGDQSADGLIREHIASANVGGSPGAGPPVPGTASVAQIAAVGAFYQTLLDHKYFDIADHAGKPYTKALTDWSSTIAFKGPVERDSLARAGKFFKRYLFKIMIILSTSSLLEAYACAKGVQVLSRTGYLSKDTNRRLKETLQFVMYVNEPDAFDEAREGKGLAAIRKVRLMHAAIRWLIRERGRAEWDQKETPINGEDLLGMLMGFSGLVLRDLPELDVALTSEEAADHLYLWNQVGRLLGAGDAWLPADLGEALALIGAVKSRQQGYSPQGVTMTKALLAYHRAVLGDLIDVATGAMRRLAGDYICDMLGVPDSEYADRSWMHDFVFRVLLWWGDKLITHDGLDVTDEAGLVSHYDPYDIPRSLRSVVFPESYN